MEPYQERVVVEKEELDVKILALAQFRKSDPHESLSEIEKKDLRDQWYCMRKYSAILAKRISLFNTRKT